MGTVLKIGGVALLVVAIAAFGRSLITDAKEKAVDERPREDTATRSASGVVFIDPSGDVPYFLYRDQGSVHTKRILFSDARTCDVSAADLPCGSDERGVTLASGAFSIEGVIDKESVIVSSIKGVSELPAGMRIYQVALAERISIGEHIYTIEMSDTTCSMGEGCVTDGGLILREGVGETALPIGRIVRLAGVRLLVLERSSSIVTLAVIEENVAPL